MCSRLLLVRQFILSVVAYDNTNRNTLFYVVYKVLNTGGDAAGLTSVHTVKPTNLSYSISASASACSVVDTVHV